MAWYSLQSGTGREQLGPLAERFPIVDLGNQLGDFHNTAAAVSHLDLVITCDSSIGHLAGALGKQVWLALAFSADWRWLHSRTDSPWYPSTKLYRQATRRNWQSVAHAMAADLRGR